MKEMPGDCPIEDWKREYDLKKSEDSRKVEKPGRPRPLPTFGGIPVVPLWMVLFFVSVALYRPDNIFTEGLLLDMTMFGSTYIINSLLVGKSLRGIMNIKYPLRPQDFSNDFRLVVLKKLTPVAILMILISCAYLGYYRWILGITVTMARPHMNFILSKYAMAALCLAFNLFSLCFFFARGENIS